MWRGLRPAMFCPPYESRAEAHATDGSGAAVARPPIVGATVPTEMHTRVWTWPFVAALSGLFLFYGSFYLTLVALPAYLNDRLSSGAAQIGLVTGLFSVGAMLPRPFVGRAADRGGAFGAMLLATGIFVLASVLYLSADTLPRLIAVRLLHGAGMACFATASPTLIAAITPPARRAEALGYWGMASTAALAVFPALGLALAAQWGYPVVFAAASLVGASSGLTVLALRRYTAANTLQVPRHLPVVGGLMERRVLVPALAGLALAAGGSIFVNFTVLLAGEKHIAQAGGFFAVYAASLCTFRVLGGRLADRYSRWRVAVPGVRVHRCRVDRRRVRAVVPVAGTRGGVRGSRVGGGATRLDGPRGRPRATGTTWGGDG